MTSVQTAQDILGYYDKSKKKIESAAGNAVLDMGKVRPGQIAKASLTMKNEFDYPVALSNPVTADKDLRITKHPERLAPKETGVVEFEFSPPQNRIIPLNASWKFDMVIG